MDVIVDDDVLTFSTTPRALLDIAIEQLDRLVLLAVFTAIAYSPLLSPFW
jgi:hypothetical protein